MKKITRFLFCTFVAIMLMGTAISATACHQKEEYPSVPEVTEPQPTGEIIPTVDRQKELKDAKKEILRRHGVAVYAWCRGGRPRDAGKGQRLLPTKGRERELQRMGLLLRPL